MTRAPHRRDLLMLWGFMGAGKTSVGRAVADRLDVPFVDLDQSISADVGMTIEAIFDARGEGGFRSLERTAIRRELAKPGPRVIALGGGSLLDARLREEALDRAFVVVLWVSVETAVRRTHGTHRPLLRAAPEVEIPKLLVSRAAAYSEAHHTLRTDGREVLDLAVDVANLWLGGH